MRTRTEIFVCSRAGKAGFYFLKIADCWIVNNKQKIILIINQNQNVGGCTGVRVQKPQSWIKIKK